MKRIVFELVLIAIALGAIWLLLQWRTAYKDLAQRHEDNVRALTAEVELAKYHDSLSMATVTALNLKPSEVKDVISPDRKAVYKDMGVQQTKDVKSDVQVESLIRDTVCFDLSDCAPLDTPLDTCVREQDEWSDIELCITGDSCSVSYVVRNDITTVVHVKYRKRFLWWRWKPEYKATSVSNNPHSLICSEVATVVED